MSNVIRAEYDENDKPKHFYSSIYKRDFDEKFITEIMEKFHEKKSVNNGQKELIATQQKYIDMLREANERLEQENEDVWYLYKWYWFGQTRGFRGGSESKVSELQIKYHNQEWEDELHGPDPSSDED